MSDAVKKLREAFKNIPGGLKIFVRRLKIFVRRLKIFPTPREAVFSRALRARSARSVILFVREKVHSEGTARKRKKIKITQNQSMQSVSSRSRDLKYILQNVSLRVWAEKKFKIGFALRAGWGPKKVKNTPKNTPTVFTRNPV